MFQLNKAELWLDINTRSHHVSSTRIVLHVCSWMYARHRAKRTACHILIKAFPCTFTIPRGLIMVTKHTRHLQHRYRQITSLLPTELGSVARFRPPQIRQAPLFSHMMHSRHARAECFQCSTSISPRLEQLSCFETQWLQLQLWMAGFSYISCTQPFRAVSPFLPATSG